MWLLGHVALTYLIIRSVWAARHKRSSGASPASHLPPDFLLLLFVFANWLDFVHVGQWRMLSHNPTATILVPSVALLLLVRWRVVERFEAALLFCASIIHMSTDILFGSFFIAYPFQTAVSTIYPFNGVEDLAFESIVALIFLMAFTWSRESNRLSKFLTETITRPQKKGESDLRSFGKRYVYPFIFIAFSSFSFVQLAVFTITGGLSNWYQVLFFILFVVFIATLLFIFLRFLSSIRNNQT